MRERLDPTLLSSLPPRETWAHNPETQGLLPTPVDERGLVDLDALVATVRSTVEPGHQWESPFNDVHHLQWESNRYTSRKKAERMFMNDFRQLSSRKAFVPRQFHNWVHRVTEPSPVPDTEVMQYCIDAERVAVSLAHQAVLATRLTRNTEFSEVHRRERLKQSFEAYTTLVDNARLVPPEYRRVPIQAIEIDSYEAFPIVAKRLGRLAIDRIPERLRALRAA